jgi:hypothetical protein
MAKPAFKVELAFNDKAPGNFFILGDATKGLLGNTTYVLQPGTVFYDVSQYVIGIQTTRGKSRALDRYQAGHVSVTFNNRNRYFDPTYTVSPFYGQIVPRRDMKVWANGRMVGYFTVDDWNLDYQPNGDNTATVSAYDAFAFLSNQTLTAGTYTSQLSGARVSAVLADPSVNWAFTSSVDAGAETLQGDTVTANDNVLQYLQLIESSEPGELFMAKDGALAFQARTRVYPSTSAPILSDDSSGIKYSQVKVVYGSELLYTQAELTRKGSSTVIQANDTGAQVTYGIRTLSQSNLLNNTDAALTDLATYTVAQYSQPEYRFEQVELIVSQQTTTNQNLLLDLDLGSICKVVFTPNGIGSAISKYAKIISINHNVDLVEHRMVIGLGTLTITGFQLDDVAFGNLDSNYLGY